MMRYLGGLIFIFVSTSIAWAILGQTIFARTYATDSRLRGEVISIWGSPQAQKPPTATYPKVTRKKVESVEDGKKIVRTVQEEVPTPLSLQRTRANVGLDLEHRQKGLLWYSTYKVTFDGEYAFRNPTGRPQDVTFTLHLPAAKAIYDDLLITVDGHPLATSQQGTAVRGTTRVAAEATATIKVFYRSQGLDTWKYDFGGNVAQVRDFELIITTNFKEIDFPENTLSPTEKRETADGWQLTWRYQNLVSGYKLGLALPQKLQPGPLAGRISFFAPISLLFFFFLIFIITTLRGIDLHPMNYFFLAAAFFSFHLLLAYLVDHISIHAAFAICSAVSIFLVVSYLRLVVGMRFALAQAGLIQFIYLVLFSYTFFLEGYTGLTITIGSILTLFGVMQMTGRVRWSEKFSRVRTAAN